MNCPRCGQENPDGFRFCGSCGADLTAAAGREIRKTITILFADVTGSTAIGERLDPESLRHVMGRYFDEMRSVIERHGGTAEKFIGDAVMAVFGIPVLHEDDARRALHAAYDMRARLSELNVDFERDFGVRIEARIGVNTGEVVTGDEASGQRLATGDAVNVAARLEQAAGPGEILLGEQTLTLARDAIETEPVEPLTLKGKSERVPAHRLLRVIEGAPSFERRLDVPLVGRREELARVRDAFRRTLVERRCQLVTVLGPPGIGKTRLAREVATDVREAADVLIGRCLPYGEGITYWPLREIFASAGAEDELDAALSAGAPEEIFYAVRKAIERRARERPLMLIVEDIHWAEPTLLELIDHVAEWTRDAELLLFCVARPELLESRPGWGARKNAETITLEPLPEDETDQLIERLLGGAPLDAGARAQVRSAAEGNPLFVEQLLAMLAEGGDTSRVPPTIQALLSARLDALPEEERRLLERASVVGHAFEWDSLTALDADLRRPSGASLSSLVRKEFIRPDETVADSFWFRHILIRDAAYARVPKELRADYHDRFARWLEGRGAEFDEIVAYHLEHAHRLLSDLGPPTARTAALADDAGRLLLGSGERASSRGDLSAAANLLERAAALLPAHDSRRRELLPSLARKLFYVGRTEQARAVFEEAIRFAASTQDPVLEAEATIELLFLKLQAGEMHQAAMREPIEQAVLVLEDAGDVKRLSRGLSILGTLGFWRGEAAAVQFLERSARLARVSGDREAEYQAINYLLLYHALGPTPIDRGLDFARGIGGASENRVLEVGLLQNIAWLEAMGGQFEQAREKVDRALSIAEELGNRRMVATVLVRTAAVDLLADDLVAAERHLRASCDIFGELGQWGFYVTPGWLLALVLCDLDRDDEAESILDTVDRYTVPEDLEPEIGRRATRAKLLARRGEFDAAEALAREAVTAAEGTEFTDIHATALVCLSEVLRRAGREREASEELEKARATYRTKGNVAELAKLERHGQAM